MQFKLEDTYSTDPGENSWRTISSALHIKYAPLNQGSLVKLVNGGELYWPDYYKDAISISKTYPHIAFKISGRGEKYNDVWWYEFFDGREVNSYKKTLNTPLTEETILLVKNDAYRCLQ